MPLQNLRNAEYNRQLAIHMILGMKLVIANYLRGKKDTNEKIPSHVKKEVDQLSKDLDNLLENINNPQHTPNDASFYFEKAMDLSNRKTGSSTLDSGKKGVLSLRKQALELMNNFEAEYKNGSDLAIESNNALIKNLITGMKECLSGNESGISSRRRTEDNYDDLFNPPPVNNLPSSYLFNPEGNTPSRSRAKSSGNNKENEIAQELDKLLLLVDDNTYKGSGDESVEGKKARHDLSLQHLREIETLSKRKTGNPAIDKKIEAAVVTKTNEWQNKLSNNTTSVDPRMKPQKW